MLLIHEKSDHAWIKRVALGMVLIELVRVRFALCCDFMNVKTNWEGIIWFHLSLGRWWGPSLGWETSRGGVHKYVQWQFDAIWGNVVAH